MKKLIFISFLSVCSLLHSQSKDVELILSHKYNNQNFELDQIYMVDDSIPMQISRLEYYLNINEFYNDTDSIRLDDYYVLVNANKSTYYLPAIELSDINKMKFHIGVDSTLNHEDPALWPAGHPLAPQQESMHWGWAAGYRFVALEAMLNHDGDSIFETVLQYHAVSDSFYTEIVHDIVTVEDDESIKIYLDVNYDKLIENNFASLGGVFHGAQEENNTLFTNFLSNNVFTNSQNLSIKDFSIYTSVQPNPFVDYINITIDKDARLNVFDIVGNLVLSKSICGGVNTLNLSHLRAGIYHLEIRDSSSKQVQRIIKH